jgi:hypothetical protein
MMNAVATVTGKRNGLAESIGNIMYHDQLLNNIPTTKMKSINL